MVARGLGSCVVHSGYGETASAVLGIEGGCLPFSYVSLAPFHLQCLLQLSMQPNRVSEYVPETTSFASYP